MADLFPGTAYPMIFSPERHTPAGLFLVTDPSVVYVIDKMTGEYLCTLTLYSKLDNEGSMTEMDVNDSDNATACSNHVGGITYDNNG